MWPDGKLNILLTRSGNSLETFSDSVKRSWKRVVCTCVCVRVSMCGRDDGMCVWV
jgi:hypothetical protein